MGKAYEKKGDRDAAIENYKASLDEHRNADVLTKLRALEKIKAKEDREAQIDPAKAEEARELGNQKFKEADWPGAVEAYTEMIKSAPNDPRGYSNRAACLIKLLSLPAAVQDCDSAIAADPKFIRAYIRKAQALFVMREYNRCIDTCVDAATHDEGQKNAREIEQQQAKAIEAQFAPKQGETEEQALKRIQEDSEVRYNFQIRSQFLMSFRFKGSSRIQSCSQSYNKLEAIRTLFVNT
jgi:stress-induced-phosphoprotein 1